LNQLLLLLPLLHLTHYSLAWTTALCATTLQLPTVLETLLRPRTVLMQCALHSHRLLLPLLLLLLLLHLTRYSLAWTTVHCVTTLQLPTVL
jgi:hypothetical protein